MSCPICLEDIIPKEQQLMPCGHAIHPPCLEVWQSKHDLCPLVNCRRPLLTTAAAAPPKPSKVSLALRVLAVHFLFAAILVESLVGVSLDLGVLVPRFLLVFFWIGLVVLQRALAKNAVDQYFFTFSTFALPLWLIVVATRFFIIQA